MPAELRTESWISAHPFAIDAAIALAPLAFFIPISFGLDVFQSVFTVPMFVALAWRRVRPEVSVALVAGLAAAHFVFGLIMGAVGSNNLGGSFSIFVFGDLAIPISLFAAAAYARRSFSIGALVAAIIGGLAQFGVIAFGLRNDSGVLDLAAIITLVVGAFASTLAVIAVWAVGRLRGTAIARREQFTERARRLEREREQDLALAAAAERARIAREMHDVVAHSLSIVIAQADGGAYLARTRPEKAAEVLETIAGTGRTALADMRRLLGVLREDDEAKLGPQPGIGDVPALVAEARGGGMRVSLGIVGETRELPGGLSLAIYRVVQESLTNVRKHAGPNASAAIDIAWHRDAISVIACDDGRGASAVAAARDARRHGGLDPDGRPGYQELPAPGGHGILGMRERAELFGASFSAAPSPGGGFAVRSRWPLTTPEPGGATVGGTTPSHTAA